MKKLLPLILCAIFIVAYLYFDNAPKKNESEPQVNMPETSVSQEIDSVYISKKLAGGSCTDTVSWVLDSEGTLTISGTGAIPDFEKGAGNQPWAGYWKSITSLSVEAGITRIGDRAFQSFRNLESAVFEGNSITIGEWAFQNCYALVNIDLPFNANIENGAFRSTPVEWKVCGKPSEAYASSRFYEALGQLTLTGNYRDDIINIALSQLDYHEGDSEADHDGGNTDGSLDYTEYGRCLESNGSAWCSEFASWCIRNAGVPTSVVASSRVANVASFTSGSTADWYSWDITTYGGGSYMPRKGDLLLWAWDTATHSTEENLSHTSILWEAIELENGTVLLRTIDGNSNNQVQIREYKVNAADGSLVGRTGSLCYIIAPDY